MAEEKKMTGYPSIDKPWLKYYSEEAIHAPLPQGTMYEYMCIHNNDRIDEAALHFFGHKISHRSLRDHVEKCVKALAVNDVKAGDLVGVCMLATPETVYLFYAINRLGAVCNFIVLNATEQDIRKQMNDCRIVFTADLALEKVLHSMNGTNVQSVISIPVTASAPFYVRQLARLKGGKKASRQMYNSGANSLTAAIRNRFRP